VGTGVYVLMSLLTGARTEELRALTWDHLNLDGQPDAQPVGAENAVTSCDSEDVGEPRSGGSDPSCD
jgi:hypothetical protein